ncbi:hypothetical protein [Streptomyces sp. H27-D2]|uniref:hypothetical protein n=1 Tax=Streptomyces sp. H27-D2 TaxID=3046304 RepID=UPI002DBE021E|nr:hypothetical protein [Streptomyces sp. H27-D2]MEC4017929.1 hypothetical protein [Streptomyces sp. H27-D2]
MSAADVDAYTHLAAAGLIGSGANNCAVAQNNAALRPDTSVTLGGGTTETDDGDIVPPDDVSDEGSEEK